MAGLQAVLSGGRTSVVCGLTATGLVAPCLLQLARSCGHLLGTPGGADPHVWLEEVLDEKCLEWVGEGNASCISESRLSIRSAPLHPCSSRYVLAFMAVGLF